MDVLQEAAVSVLWHALLLLSCKPKAFVRTTIPGNLRELLSLLGIAVPALILPGVSALIPLAGWAMLAGMTSAPRRPGGARGERSSLIAHYLPMLLFTGLFDTMPPSTTSPDPLSWARFVTFACCFAGSSRDVLSDYPVRRLVLCAVCVLWHFGATVSVLVAGLLVVLGLDHCRRMIFFHLPNVFSETEADLVLVLGFGVVATMTAHSAAHFLDAPEPLERDTLMLVSGGLIVFALWTASLLWCVFSSRVVQRLRSERLRVFIFYSVAMSSAFGMYAPWMSILTGVHPLIWVINYIASTPSILAVLGYWAVVVAAGGLIAYKLQSSAIVPQIMIRKVYHLMVVVMFIPGVIYTPELMSLSYAVALALFVLLEAVRILQMPPLGKSLGDFMSRFIDERDSGVIITTHIYLLLGCALPHWGVMLRPEQIRSKWDSVIALSGVIALGVSDSAASVVGRAYGSHQWTGIHKTIEGTAAGIVATMCTAGLLLVGESVSMWAAVMLVWQCWMICLLEAFTLQVDNLVLPMALCVGLVVCQHLQALS